MINSIRILRALAAWVVVYHHCVQVFYGLNVEYLPLSLLAKYGSVGVDLFFVISGFVIYHSVYGKEISIAGFAWNRLVRIVPVYWLFTLITAAIVMAFPGVIPLTGYEFGFLLKSLLFFPEKNPSGIGYFPLLTVGWTLNYEMVFYAIFGLALAFNRKLLVLALIVALYLLKVISNKFEVGSFYGSSIVLEFLLGVLIGIIYKSGRLAMNHYVALAFIFSGGAAILASSGVSHAPVGSGIPCAVIFYGFLSLEKFFDKNTLLARLGDWSYSTYLCHIIIISLIFNLSKIYTQVPFFVWLAVISLVVVVVSLVSYKFVERPCVERLKGFWVRQLAIKEA